jgi:hypothetical protein
MLWSMGRVPRMPAPPLASPALMKTDTHAKPVDESGKDIGVPQSLVLCVFSALPCTLIYPTASCEGVPHRRRSAVHPSERGFLKGRTYFLATDSSRGPGVAACAGAFALKPPVLVPANTAFHHHLIQGLLLALHDTRSDPCGMSIISVSEWQAFS